VHARIALLTTTLALGLLTAATPAQVQETRLTPADPITSDILGYDVAFDGTTIVAGAPFGSFGGYQLPGRAFVFAQVDGTWQQTQKLLPESLQSQAFFGVNVTIDGDTLAIAASGEDLETENEGAVYVFEQTDGLWSQAARLTASDATTNGSFGAALALQNDTLLIGASGDSHAGGDYAGAVYVFERSAGTWTEIDKLTASDPAFDDNFGSSLALDGDTAVIGAIDDDHGGYADPGAAYIFTNVAGTWQEATKLIASDPGDESYFGVSVALDGDTVVVGAEQHTHGGLSGAGVAYVFQRDGDGWPQVGRLTSPAPDAGDRFGCDVTLEADTLVVGAHLDNTGSRVGAAYVYRRIDGLWQADTQLLAADDGNTNFGWRLALRGTRAAIAGPFYRTNRGAVYVFKDMIPVVPGDVDGDGDVDLSDLAALLAAFNTCAGDADYNPEADFDDSGCVDLSDLAALLANYRLGG
jgi:hypothetical protein